MVYNSPLHFVDNSTIRHPQFHYRHLLKEQTSRHQSKMADQIGVVPWLQTVEGLRIPFGFSGSSCRSAIRLRPRPNDLFIVTYPKCGTTWAQFMVGGIHARGGPFPSLDKFYASNVFLDYFGTDAYDIMAKYICVARNPKDCCVSYFHHMHIVPHHGFSGTFDQFFEMFLSGDIDYGDYFDHLMGWYEHRNDPNVLFLTYEEMKENPKAAILKMASFINEEEFAAPLRKDPEKLNCVLCYSSFDRVKDEVNEQFRHARGRSQEDISRLKVPDVLKKVLLEVHDRISSMGPLPPQAPSQNFLRKGVVGDWRNHFSEEQSNRLDQKFAERTKGMEISGCWKECMKYDQV